MMHVSCRCNEISESVGMHHVPAQVELLAEGNGGHDGDDECLDGLVHGHEHRAASVDAPYLHGECDPRRDHSLRSIHSHNKTHMLYRSSIMSMDRTFC